MTGQEARITGAYELPYRRDATDTTTLQLLSSAFTGLLEETGYDRDQIDGLGVASFSLSPDNAIDVAWHLGLTVDWLMEDPHGGASAINMLSHAVRAIEAGDAKTIVLLAGDGTSDQATTSLQTGFNSVVTKYLAPLPYGGANGIFALLTATQMKAHGLTREDYGHLVIAQRNSARLNPKAVYRAPMTMEDYLNAPMIADPLGRFDCVPVVAGADALLLTRADLAKGGSVRIRAICSRHNYDQQMGDGLRTGLSQIAGGLWKQSGLVPADMDVVSVYDDYPAMVLAQLQDLGFTQERSVRAFIRDVVYTGQLPVNTSGGQLSVGQAGAAGGMHGLVEVVTQLLGRASQRQIPNASLGVVSGYGMVQYRYCQCANAAVMERAS